jgi:quinol-cytochrome oxidoreductase complex cytochrome b subunit/coenzyme F420-reducing hydrogenase delta subunit
MAGPIRQRLKPALARVEAGFDAVFGEADNPWNQLGGLCFFFFWIVAVTGIYLFIFFDTSQANAYASIARITNEQFYIGNLMRTMHRYASDAMVVTATLHLLRELVLGRFRGVRWFSWFSGVPLLWLLFAAGIGGYWLVWDRLAQYIAIATTEWIDWLPVFSDALARNFLNEKTLSDRLFSLLVFLHIAIPLFLLVGIFIHIKRIKLATSTPSRQLLVGTLVSLVLVSVAMPVDLAPPADLSTTVAQIDLDWFFLNIYPLLDSPGPGWVWGLLVAVTGILAILPWVASQPEATHTQPAIVNPENCNGCGWCFQDCPYDAIVMVDHSFKAGHKQALVDVDQCTACGICEGACPSATPFRNVETLISGIEIPDFPLDRLRQETQIRLDALGETTTADHIFIFGCDHALTQKDLKSQGVSMLTMPCTGMLPPSFADYVARQPEISGVLITGCHPANCFFRKGSEWTAQRFGGERMPHLRTRAAKGKVRIRWAGSLDGHGLDQEIVDFRAHLNNPQDLELANG